MLNKKLLSFVSLIALSLFLTACASQSKQNFNSVNINHPPALAQGNEPGWQAALVNTSLEVRLNYGQDELIFNQLKRQPTKQGWLITSTEETSLKVKYKQTLCQDSMTGMPYPWQVELLVNQQKFTGCGGKVEELLLGEWQIEDINNQGIIDSSFITLAFSEEGRVYGSTGCNRYNTSYQLSGEGLTFGHGLTTKMACAEALMNQENKFLASLNEITHLTINKQGALVLTGPKGISLKGFKIDN